MRALILIALLFVFTAGCFADMAHAAEADHMCIHHEMDQDDNANNEPCDPEEEHSQCDDCCSAHSHSMTTAVESIRLPYDRNTKEIIVSTDHYSSIEPSNLKRPPRL